MRMEKDRKIAFTGKNLVSNILTDLRVKHHIFQFGEKTHISGNAVVVNGFPH